MKVIVIAIVAVLLGGALGVVSAPWINQQILANKMKSVSRQYKDLNFQRCTNETGDGLKNCADSIFEEEALRRSDRNLCEQISNPQVKANCLNRLQIYINVSNAQAFCGGISKSPLCLDLAITLAAHESRDPNKCSQISNLYQKQACTAMILGPDTMGYISPNARAEVKKYTFGLNCDESVPLCLQEKRTFNSAVSTNNPGLCKDLGGNKSRCEIEVAAYQVYKTGNFQLCSKLVDAEACRVDYAIAKALDAGNDGPCAQLSANGATACREVIETLNEKRFEYLSQGI